MGCSSTGDVLMGGWGSGSTGDVLMGGWGSGGVAALGMC